MKLTRSTLIAAGLCAAVFIWMLTGLAGDSSSSTPIDAPTAEAPRSALSVRVRESAASPVTRAIEVSARTQPNRSVEIAAETIGQVVSIAADRGAPVREGDVILTLDMRDRAAREAEAQALVSQRELEFQAAERLRGREFLSEAQIAEAGAQLQSARADLANIRMEIARTTITAPFDGMLEERGVELGDFVNVGDPVATVVDVDPLIVAGDVSERDIHQLRVGTQGEAILLSGEGVSGEVRYISPVASDATRTFRVELAIPNPGAALRAGMSAQVSLPAGEVRAHRMTPALLTLDDEGRVGVKTVDERDRVQFHPVEIVVSDQDGVWVTGLPERVRVITVGQGFVAAGETVRPVAGEDILQVEGYTAADERTD